MKIPTVERLLSSRSLSREIDVLKRFVYVDPQTSILESLFAPSKFVGALNPFPTVYSYGTEDTTLIELIMVFDGKAKRSEITVQCMRMGWHMTFLRIDFYTICESQRYNTR